MDILYLYKDDGLNGESLRYSLRSIAKYGKNIDRVFICGDCPDWLSDKIIKIKYTSNCNAKNKRIWDQVLYAVNNSDIGINNHGDFLVSMDDHFYCQETDFNNYPFYVKDYIKRAYRYLLPNYVDYTKASPDYQQIMVNTYHYCLNNQLSMFNFVPHRNMHINRNLINATSNFNEYLLSDDSPEIEALCVHLNLRHKFYPFRYEICLDIKSSIVEQLKAASQNSHIFSTNDFELNSLIHKFLQELYPEKCKYENEANNNSQTIPEAGSERNTSI